MSEKKVYGLIIPKKGNQGNNKKAPTSAPAFNVFGDDDDSEEEGKRGPVGPFGYTKTNTKLKLQNQMDIEKAMMEDPSVYEYDEIYDDIQASKPQMGKQEETAKVKKNQKPLYIAGLLKAAEVKKKENERRNERKVQKEREAEGEKYADKEAFVTSAYKQKMLQMQQEAEEEQRKEELEALTDVTKQKDLGGFYRYLYRQTTASQEGVKEEDVKDRIKEEPPDDVEEGIKTEADRESSRRMRQTSSSPCGDEPESQSNVTVPFHTSRQRGNRDGHYRSAQNQQTDSESEDGRDGGDVEGDKTSRGKTKSKGRIHESPEDDRNKRGHMDRSGRDSKRTDRNYRRPTSHRSRSPEERDRRGREDSRDNRKEKTKKTRYRSSSSSSSSLSPLRSERQKRSREREPETREGKRNRGRDEGKARRKLSRSRSHSRSRSPRRPRYKSPARKHDRRRSGSRSRKEAGGDSNVGRGGERRGRGKDSESPVVGRIDGASARRGETERVEAFGIGKRDEKDVSDNQQNSGGSRELDGDTSIDAGDVGPPTTSSQMPTNLGKADAGTQKTKKPPVDPRYKVYPHHNSPKDIEAARKRYLIRKIDRENSRGS